MPEEQPIEIKQLYPHFTDEELAQAEANLRRFVHVMTEIYEERKCLRGI